MVSTAVPQVFTDWKMQSSELHIARLFQLLTQVLNRITACSNLFDNVTRLHLPGLETVDRFPVLGAVAGILITLLMHGTNESKERSTSALLADPGFTLESVEFLIGGKSSIPGKAVTLQQFSFIRLLNKDVSADEVKEVQDLVSYLEQQSTKVRLEKQESVDVDEGLTQLRQKRFHRRERVRARSSHVDFFTRVPCELGVFLCDLIFLGCISISVCVQMKLILHASKIASAIVILNIAAKAVFCIECYHCKGSELTEARCADNYTLQTCGSSPDGKAYNACFSHNITYNMPIFGIRYKEEKGCTIAMEHCDFLRTIYCGDDSNVVVNCSFNCCDNNRCNLGHLTPVDGDPTTPDEMTSRFPMDPRTFPSYRASSTQQTQSSTDHEMKTPIVESKGCELHSELWLKILFSLIVMKYY
ncbi:E3 ubiquitin-protein ligase RNF123 [Exaiptasia diaphana]|nr:E3 ubiquitin-protein ligase RNF123 [Exaiptasia diaphana]